MRLCACVCVCACARVCVYVCTHAPAARQFITTDLSPINSAQKLTSIVNPLKHKVSVMKFKNSNPSHRKRPASSSQRPTNCVQSLLLTTTRSVSGHSVIRILGFGNFTAGGTYNYRRAITDWYLWMQRYSWMKDCLLGISPASEY
jgi:hypothetical protein